jgi:5-methylcytosine-specific restriction enzyme subunit McrC
MMGVRGSIRFDERVRKRFGIPLPVEVRFDEFTEDILENRLLKAALRLLRRRSPAPAKEPGNR